MESVEAWRLTGDLQVEHGKADPFAAAIRATRMPMVISDARRPDHPILFANDAFLALTGYCRDEVTGRNCRFLQGPDTDPATVRRLRAAVAAGRDIKADVLNYRKDGSAFWNALYISPVTNARDEAVYFFASQMDVTERIENQQRIELQKERFEEEVLKRTLELQRALEDGRATNQKLEAALQAQRLLTNEVDHRVKNNLQMISSLINLQGRNIADPAIRLSLSSMLERVETLSAVHRRLYQSGDLTRFDLAECARELSTELLTAAGRADIRLELDLDPVQVPAEQAAPIALMVNELVTNALKHAFVKQRPGKIVVSLKRQGGCCCLSIADDGVGMEAAGDAAPATGSRDTASKPSFGRSLVESLGRQLRATTRWLQTLPGTRVEIRLPLVDVGAH
jgi:PAS domain S-box-containing protein